MRSIEEHRLLVVPERLLSTFRSAEAAGYSVQGSTQATLALRLAREWAPEVVVLDSALQGEMSALDFAYAVRELLPRPGVLLLTEQLADADTDLTAIPCDAHIVLPIETQHAVVAVQALLRILHMREQAQPLDLFAQVSAAGKSMAANIIALDERTVVLECEDTLPFGIQCEVSFFAVEAPVQLQLTCRVVLGDELKLHYAADLVALQPATAEWMSRFLTRRS